MKTILSALALAAASTALAVTSSNTFGVLRVDSTTAQTIVSVPWAAAGGGEVNIADVVKTANLHNGDKLYYYDTTKKGYRVWELTDGAWVEAKDAMAPSTDAPTLARGNAIILERTAPIASCFYLYGQYTTSSATTECVAGGYTLLAPPTATECNLNNLTWSKVGANDRIGVPNAKGLSLAYLQYVENQGWGIKKGAEFDKTMATVPAGQGVWYISRGTTAPTINW